MFRIETGTDTKILRKVIAPVAIFDDSLVALAEEMQETMEAPDPETGITGIGLAANQVGIDKRMILMNFNINTKKEPKLVVMINPEIMALSPQTNKMEEGCLSLPGQFADVVRPAKAHIKWQNLKGNWCEKKLDKWDARIFLHEFDHLEGKLFTDYL